MLLSLTAHIIITVCCLWSGFLFYNFFREKNKTRPLVFYLISGLILLASFAQIIVLFFPIGLMTQLVFAIAILISIVLKWNDFRFLIKKSISEISGWPLPLFILFLITWGIILLMNAGPVIMDDTESYHIQIIKWIQEYGSVPGLVNLHERFGFNSSWFSSVALFNFSSMYSGSYTLLNSVLSLWICYWLISKYNSLLKNEKPNAALAILVIIGCCLMVWPLVRGNAATANYDFIAAFILFIFFIEIFLSPGKEISPTIEWIVWPVYLLTVRIINFPFLLLSLLAVLFFINQKKLKTVLLPVFCCLLLIIPFLARNIIIAGSPFFPASYFDWFKVDWKPDPQMTERLLEYIKYYNRVATTWLDIEQTKALGPNWIPSWFHYLFIYDKILVVAGGSGLLLSAIKLFISNQFYCKKNILLIAISITALLCWFLISPDPRFIYGIFLFGVYLLVYHSASFIKNTGAIKPVFTGGIIVLIAGTGFYCVLKPVKQTEYGNWILPSRLPKPPVKEIIIEGITFSIPEPINNNWNVRCYGTQLPCLYKIDPRLKPRGKNIRDGFRLEK